MTRPEAILLDALGTMVRLERPAPHLQADLRERIGLELAPEQASTAIRAEIQHYRANLHRGVDADSLAALRRECAAVMLDHLPAEAAEAGLDVITQALVASIRFQPFPEVMTTLQTLRERGLRLVVLSNWDVSLHEMLAATGIAELVDGAVSSAEHGTAKPDPAIFEHALGLAGVEAERAWHVGDSPEADVVGARAANITPLLVQRDGAPVTTDVRVIRDLAELVALTG